MVTKAKFPNQVIKYFGPEDMEVWTESIDCIDAHSWCVMILMCLVSKTLYASGI